MAVMSCLAELSVHGYTASGFAKYAGNMFGPGGILDGMELLAGLDTRTGAEGIAVATYLRTFAIFHPYPIWLIALVIFIIDGAINLVGVLTMGNYEFTLSGLKIATLTLFAIVGLAGIIGIGIPAVRIQSIRESRWLPSIGGSRDIHVIPPCHICLHGV